LHLVQPAHAALELRAVLALGEQPLGLGCGRGDELDAFIVKHIHQPGEAPRGTRAARLLPHFCALVFMAGPAP
jgi:hypothetical protein